MVKVLGILKKWSLYLIGDFSPVILDSEAFASKTKLLFDKKCFHQHLQKLKDKLISRRAKNRGTTFIQWTCHSWFLCNCYNRVAWFSILDGSQHRHFSGLRWRENQFSTLVLYRFFDFESTGKAGTCNLIICIISKKRFFDKVYYWRSKSSISLLSVW